MISICSSRGPLAFMFQMLFIQVTASLSLKSSCENPESFEREWELWYVYYIAIWYYAFRHFEFWFFQIIIVIQCNINQSLFSVTTDNGHKMKPHNPFLPLLARCGIAASFRLHFNYSPQAVSSAIEDRKLDKKMDVMLELVEWDASKSRNLINKYSTATRVFTVCRTVWYFNV